MNILSAHQSHAPVHQSCDYHHLQGVWGACYAIPAGSVRGSARSHAQSAHAAASHKKSQARMTRGRHKQRMMISI